MLKITSLSRKRRGQTVEVENEIREFSVGVVRDSFTKHVSRSKRLDLVNVIYVDAFGVELLRDLMREGAKITACWTFVADKRDCLWFYPFPSKFSEGELR